MEYEKSDIGEDGYLKVMPNGLQTCLLVYAILVAMTALPLLISPDRLLGEDELDVTTETLCRFLALVSFMPLIIALNTKERRPHLAIDSLNYLMWWGILTIIGHGFAIYEGSHPEWWWSHLVLIAMHLGFLVVWVLSHSNFRRMVDSKRERDNGECSSAYV